MMRTSRQLAIRHILLLLQLGLCIFVGGELADLLPKEEASEASGADRSSESSQEEGLTSFTEQQYSELRSLYRKSLKRWTGEFQDLSSIPQREVELRSHMFEYARLERLIKSSEATSATKKGSESESEEVLTMADLEESMELYKQYLESLVTGPLGIDGGLNVHEEAYQRYLDSVSKIYEKLDRHSSLSDSHARAEGHQTTGGMEKDGTLSTEAYVFGEEEEGKSDLGGEDDDTIHDDDEFSGGGYMMDDDDDSSGGLDSLEEQPQTVERTGNVTARLTEAQDMLYGLKSKRNITAAILLLKDIAALVPSAGSSSTAYWRPPYYPDDPPEAVPAVDLGANKIATSGVSVSEGRAGSEVAMGAVEQGGDKAGLPTRVDGSGAAGGEAGDRTSVQGYGMSPVSSSGLLSDEFGLAEEMPEPWGGVPGLTAIAGSPPSAQSPPETPPAPLKNDKRSNEEEMAASDARFLLAVLSSLGIAQDHQLNDTEAVNELKRSSELGSIPAMLALADRHFHGRGVRKSCGTAFWYVSTAAQEMLLQAEEEGDHHLPPEALRLRESFRSASYVQNLMNEDNAEFVDWDEDLAMHGVPQAQRRMGFRQLLGRGIDRDPDAAFRHFQAAAAGGDHVAAFNLGYMYMRGISVPTNFTAARKLFTESALKNFPAAFNGLGVLHFNGWGVPLDYVEARRYFEMGASPPHNNTDSLYNLASIYLMGYGVEPNATTAFSYLEQAAINYHWRAPFSLALMHFEGSGTPLNCSRAVRLMNLFVSERRVRWTELADAAAAFEGGDHWAALVRYGILAEQGCAIALENAAFMLRRGYGYSNPDRHDLALSMCLRSAAAGNLYSYIDAGDLHYERLVSNASDAKVVEYYEKAAVSEDPEALYSLAFLHQHGSRGLAQNFSRAEELLEAALAATSRRGGEEEAFPVLVALGGLYAHRALAAVGRWARSIAAFLEQVIHMEIEENHVCLMLGVFLAVVCYQLWARNSTRRRRDIGQNVEAGVAHAEGDVSERGVVSGDGAVNGVRVGAVELSEQPGASERVAAEAVEETGGEIGHAREGMSSGDVPREGGGGHPQELRRRILRTS